MTIKITKKINKIKIDDIPLIQTVFAKRWYCGKYEYHSLAGGAPDKCKPIGIFTSPKNNKQYMILKGFDKGCMVRFATYYNVVELHSEIHTNEIEYNKFNNPLEKLQFDTILDENIGLYSQKRFPNLNEIKYYFENTEQFKFFESKL
tara:strand:+ start:4018 stop:4458 length:441 start_codon:yes stop_codon:yes gene_type:complete